MKDKMKKKEQKCRIWHCDNKAEFEGLCGLHAFIEFDTDALPELIEEEIEELENECPDD